jgi:hypothetical protein
MVVIVCLVGTSAAAAEERCHTKYRTIVSHSQEVLTNVMEHLMEPDISTRLKLMETRGLIVMVNPGHEIYVIEAPGDSRYRVRFRELPDVFLALAFQGFDCPTPAPKRPTKKPKRP